MVNNKYKKTAAVFDLDNTLIDSKAKLKADFVGAMTRLGVEMTPEESEINWYETAAKYGFSKEVFDEAFDQRKTWEQSLEAGEVPIFPETRQCLEELAGSGVRMALLSKSIPKYTDAKLEYFDLRKYFQTVETVHPEKPNKEEGAYKILNTLNPDTLSLTCFIGDRDEDVTVAKEVQSFHSPFYEEVHQRHFECKGIYVNREGEQLEGHTSVKDINEVNKIILDK